MTTVKKIAENSGIVILGDVLEGLINLLMAVALARYFGQVGFGKLSFLATFFFFLASVDNQWIRPILVREMSRDSADAGRLAGNGLIIKFLVSFLAVAVFWIIIAVIRPSRDIAVLAIFTSLGLLTSSLVSSYEIIFQVRLKIRYFVGINLFTKVLSLILICLVIFFKQRLLVFYILNLAPGLVLLLLAVYYSKGLIKPDFKIDIGLWRRIFRQSWPLGLTACFIFIYHRIDQTLLLYFRGAEELGLYAAGLKLVESLNIVPLAFMVPMLPLLSGYFHNSEADFQHKYRLSFRYLLMFIIPLAMGISLFSGQIIRLFYGEQFSASALSLAVLIWSEVFVFMGVVNNAVLISSNKQAIDPVFTGLSALVSIGLNLFLIPRYGILGAASAAVASCATGPIIGYFIPLTREYSESMFRASLKPLLASLVAILPVYYFKLDLWALVVFGPVIYLIALYFTGGLDRQDLKRAGLIFSHE